MDTDRPIRSCDHKSQHHHGTRAGHKNCGCRCDDCCEARREYDRGRKRADRRGGKRNPIDNVRAHIKHLKSYGMSPKLIAERAGVQQSTVQSLDRGEHKYVISGTEELILAVTPERMAPRKDHVPATASVRRLRHLALQGWCTKDVAAIASLRYRTLQDVIRGERDTLSAANAREIEAATRVLLTRTPPTGRVASTVASIGIRKGWVSMFAYDDIDDPDEVPNVTPMVRKTRDEAAHDRLEDLAHLINAGIPAEEATTRAGYPTMKAAYEAARHRGLTNLIPHLLSQKDTAA